MGRAQLISAVCAAIDPVLNGILEIGPFRVDFEQRRCFVDGVDVRLCELEFEFFAELFLKFNKLVDRGSIRLQVWQSPPLAVNEGTVNVTLIRLREKLGVYGACVETVRGRGWILRLPSRS